MSGERTGKRRDRLDAGQTASSNHRLSGRMMRRYAPTQWNRPKVGALFVLTAFTLAACATPQPYEPSNSRTDVPAVWSAAQPTVPATDLTQWWERFHDPILSRLIDDALVANPTLEGAAASLQQARALRDVAEAGLWPQGQGTGSARRSTQGTAASNRAASTLVSLGIEESWTLDVFGGKRSALAAQQAAVWSRMANLGDYRVQISAELATTYINLRAAQARLALAQQTLSSQSHTRQLVGWRRQAGLVSALDSDQADFAFASTQASLPALQNAITQSSHALSVLTGRPPLELVGLLEEVRAVPVVETSLVLNLPAETLRRRADVRAGEFAVLEALGRLGQAEAATKPSFTLGGSIGLSAAGLGTLLNGSSLLTALSASVLVPIGPGPAAQVRADQAGVELAKHAYRGTVLSALRDVEDALERLRDNQAFLASLTKANAAASRAYGLAQIRYRSGLIDFQTVLDTERAAFSSRDGLVTARANLSLDSITLYKALGGGWDADLREQP